MFLAAAVSLSGSSALHHQLTRGSSAEYAPTVSPTSPGAALQRKSSKRITAQEGSRILDKFLHRTNTQDDEALADASNDKQGKVMIYTPCLYVS